MKKPSASIYFDTRNMPEGSNSVKWSIYYNAKQKQFSTGLVVNDTDAEFLKTNKNGLSGRVKDDYRRNLWEKVYGDTYVDQVTGQRKEGLLAKARRVLIEIEDVFSFQLFTSVISGGYQIETETAYPSDLLIALIQRSKKLLADEDVANSSLFSCTEASLKRFLSYKKLTSETRPELPFKMVNKNFLRDYEKWMLRLGKRPQKKDGKESPASITTVAIYCRNIRTVFNEALSAKVISEIIYPFGKDGYKIPKAKSTKKALDSDIVGKIMYYQCDPGSNVEMYRDLWVFSYLCNGSNLSDICRLKCSDLDVKSNTLSFLRKKTKTTKREEISKIEIALFPITLDIINKWGNPKGLPEDYLFPFLTHAMDEAQRKKSISYVIKLINKYLNKIAKELKIEVKINTYEARHTFATTLLRAEAPLAFISQKLGHGSIATTQHYLGSFENEQSNRYLSVLIPKPKEEPEVK